MTYVISIAESKFNTYWKPSEYRQHYLCWEPEQIFEWISRDADPAGTWQEWTETEDKAEADTEWKNLQNLPWRFADISASNGHVAITVKAFKLERIDDPEGDVELLDWYAEGFEHEPESEPKDE